MPCGKYYKKGKRGKGKRKVVNYERENYMPPGYKEGVHDWETGKITFTGSVTELK